MSLTLMRVAFCLSTYRFRLRNNCHKQEPIWPVAILACTCTSRSTSYKRRPWPIRPDYSHRRNRNPKTSRHTGQVDRPLHRQKARPSPLDTRHGHPPSIRRRTFYFESNCSCYAFPCTLHRQWHANWPRSAVTLRAGLNLNGHFKHDSFIVF